MLWAQAKGFYAHISNITCTRRRPVYQSYSLLTPASPSYPLYSVYTCSSVTEDTHIGYIAYVYLTTV